ncbi:MAG: very short patch repair endonuclease, partial [Phycisphaerae bacterium]|nr:very short patch repair endonuclease [Phycisphaerae bacterium]
HDRRLPGSPDLVFPGRRKIIFVHGCFWHRHRCRFGRVMPSTRREFWAEKLEKNRLRDAKNRRALRRLGWDVLVIWECQVVRLEWLASRLVSFLEERRTDPGPAGR